MSLIPTTHVDYLSLAGSPSAGVGDLEDLRLVLGIGAEGRWTAFIKPGWFYSDGLEQYNYTSKGEQTQAASSKIQTVTSGSSFHPAWAPVLVYGPSNAQYTEHHNCHLPAMPLSWSPSSPGVFSAPLATGYLLLGVRGTGQDYYGRAASSGDVLFGRLYSYDPATRRIFAAMSPAASSLVWADLATTTPQLKFRETVVVDGNGQCQASYQAIREVTASKNGTTVSCADVNDGVVTHGLSADEGDWIVLEYYINRSYVVAAHNQIVAYTGLASGEALTVHYELSPPEYLKQASQASPVAGDPIQLNPLFSDSFRTGFLYHSSEPPSGVLYRLSLSLDRTEAIGSWREAVKATILATDRDGIPLPQLAVRVWHNQAASGLLLLSPSATGLPSGYNTRTDNRGEVHVLLMPTAASGTLLIGASSGTSTSSGAVSLLAASQALPVDRYLAGTVNLVQTARTTARGYTRVYASPHLLDGIPRTSSAGIYVQSAKTSAFEYTDSLGAETVATRVAYPDAPASAENPGRVAGLLSPFGVSVAGVDSAVASADGGQSPIVTLNEEP